MTSPRDAFLQRVRQAVVEGNRAGTSPALPSRGPIGYQGAGGDPMQRICEQLTAAGGVPHLVSGVRQAIDKVLALVAEKKAQRVLLGRGAVLDSLQLGPRLQSVTQEVIFADQVEPYERDILFTADLGISGVAYLIAETGTVVVASKAEDPRSVSLLPPVHIAVASEKQLLPDLFDLFESLKIKEEDEELPSGIVLITGPSKTGDIELKLVTGVHGPGEVHVVLISED